jgi:hypothetical protein
MYDDLLGKRKTGKEQKPNIIIPDIGKCIQCSYVVDKSSVYLYCKQINKFVNGNQIGCLLFKQRKTSIKSL